MFFQIAKAEKLKPLEVELKKLEDLSESIVNEFAYMRAREEEMRDTNGMLLRESIIIMCRLYNNVCPNIRNTCMQDQGPLISADNEFSTAKLF